MPGNTVAEVDPSPRKKRRDMFIKIYNASKMHSNQTGPFPAMPSKGNQYIMALVEVDGNYIDAEPMKSKSQSSIIKTYLILWTRLTESGIVRPITHILDNKASEENKADIKKNCTMQLVPPGTNQQNLAKRAMQTFKNHFKAIKAGVDGNFPMNLWDRLTFTQRINQQSAPNSKGAQRDTNSKGEIPSPNHHQSHS